VLEFFRQTGVKIILDEGGGAHEAFLGPGPERLDENL
jgi:hypothetical protein